MVLYLLFNCDRQRQTFPNGSAIGFIPLLANDPNIHAADVPVFREVACQADPAPTAEHFPFGSGFRAGARACVRNARGALPIPDHSRGQRPVRRSRAPASRGHGHSCMSACRFCCRYPRHSSEPQARRFAGRSRRHADKSQSACRLGCRRSHRFSDSCPAAHPVPTPRAASTPPARSRTATNLPVFITRPLIGLRWQKRVGAVP